MLFPTTVTSSRRTIRLRPRACIDPNHWVWPLPGYANAQPRIVGRADDSRMAVDVGYYASGSPSALVPVYAVHDGIIQLARETVSGFAMVVDHHGEWSSYYGRLRQMICSPTWDDARPRVRVRAGQILGYTTSEAPIRFELWRWTDDAGFVPTAPEPHMSKWIVLSDRDPHPADEVRNSTTHATTKAAA